jgi:hypothetical protein
MNVDQMAQPDTIVFVARDTAGGALPDHPDRFWSRFYEKSLR